MKANRPAKRRNVQQLQEERGTCFLSWGSALVDLAAKAAPLFSALHLFRLSATALLPQMYGWQYNCRAWGLAKPIDAHRFRKRKEGVGFLTPLPVHPMCLKPARFGDGRRRTRRRHMWPAPRRRTRACCARKRATDVGRHDIGSVVTARALPLSASLAHTGRRQAWPRPGPSSDRGDD